LNKSATRVAVLYPSDPLGFVPSGIDSFIRGILKWAPDGLHYTLIGATSDVTARPLGKTIAFSGLNHESRIVPIVAVDASAQQTRVPLTIRYMWALRRYLQRSSPADFDALDFHRPEPVVLFRRDPRPKNLVLHQDMSVIRGRSSDIRWRHWPWLYEQFEDYIFRHVDHVFCVRQSAVDRYRAMYPDTEGKFEFIPTWVDDEIFGSCAHSEARDALRSRVRAELGVPPGAVLLIFVGRLDRQKDPMLLLDSLRVARTRVSELHLIMIGDGALRSQVEERINTIGIAGQVRLLGALPPSRIAELLRAGDLFVLSSAYEGMPIAVLEALASGLPVVSTDVGEIGRVVKDGINGTISAARTPAAMAEAIGGAMAKIDLMRGAPCRDSVRQFGPSAVLGLVYQHHRAQAARIQGAMPGD
jgi:glycosyltransferase involved in cell wall biosynthesis